MVGGTQKNLKHPRVNTRWPALAIFSTGNSTNQYRDLSLLHAALARSRYFSQGYIAMEIDGAALLAKGAFIADALYRHCFLPDEGVRMRRTASIAPGTSLKHVAARKAFRWAANVGGGKKFFTLAACRKGVQLLLEKPDVVVPFVGLPQNLWVESQAKLVMKLAQRARKNSGASLRFWAYHQSKLMDWDDPLPMEAGAIIISWSSFQL